LWQSFPVGKLRLVGRQGNQIELLDEAGISHFLEASEELKELLVERKLTSVVDTPTFSIKEIQSRLRAGENFQDLAQRFGLPLEKIERYASPILQERAWIIELAEKSSPKGAAVTLGELLILRMVPRGIAINQLSWDTWKFDDGTWNLLLTYPTRDGEATANWIFDAQKRTLTSQDDGARWISGEELPSKSQSKSDRMIDHGVLFPVEGENSTPPRLVAVRSTPEDESDLLAEPTPEVPVDAKKDGVTKRISIPSWDDIMFGKSKKKEEGEEL
jgi:hypothetical protein